MKRCFTFIAISFLLPVIVSFKVVFCASFFFLFINFIITIWTANNTTISVWHDETCIKNYNDFEACTWCLYFVFSNDMEEKQHDLYFLPPLAMQVFKSTVAHSHSKSVYIGQLCPVVGLMASAATYRWHHKQVFCKWIH